MNLVWIFFGLVISLQCCYFLFSDGYKQRISKEFGDFGFGSHPSFSEVNISSHVNPHTLSSRRLHQTESNEDKCPKPMSDVPRNPVIPQFYGNYRSKYLYPAVTEEEIVAGKQMHEKLKYNFEYFESQACKTFDMPQIIDALVYDTGKQYEVYVVYNMMNILWELFKPFQHRKVVISHNGKTYKNQGSVGYWEVQDCLCLFVEIPYEDSHVDMKSGCQREMTLIVQNQIQNLNFTITAQIVPVTSPPIWDYVLVGYVSSYNSVEEILRWIAYHKIRGIDHISLYAGDEASEVIAGLRKVIESGYLTISKFHYVSHPTFKQLKVPQRTNQVAAVYSGLVRMRYLANYAAVIDVDEYLSTQSLSTPLTSALSSLFNMAVNDQALILSTFFFSSLENENVSVQERDEFFLSRQFFSRYRYRNALFTMDAPKIVHRLSDFHRETALHYCACKATYMNQYDNPVFISHFKKNRYVPPVIEDTTMIQYENSIEALVSTLHI